MRAFLLDEFCIAAELNRITQPLLGREQDALARNLIARAPQRLWPGRLERCAGALPSPFIERPAAAEISRQQKKQALVPKRVRVSRVQRKRSIIARHRLGESMERL